ncbi:hypothetical protein F503_01384 [Ophiostoma piceae UAMH 11346]|uniref:Uncharacterized protein n=1 Tax=Ophiostoma piceae (strain UAMH 11346) TaxID=1262450 RepID=S3CUI5_OPHP1|nr:hypothetical protein F503_01384 [Ophiostoma piceae UAMH 11346]
MAPRRDHRYAFIDDSQSPTSPPRPPTAPASPNSYTLSTKHQHHQVRFQGRRMLVKSVSANFKDESKESRGESGENWDNSDNARDKSNQNPRARENAADSSTEPRMVSETELRKSQRRGFGIGGVGNIRRPTEVLHFYSLSNRTVADHDEHRQGKKRWQWMNTLLRRKDRSSYSYEKY